MTEQTSELVPATRAVVNFITTARWQDFPSDAVHLAKRCIVDGLGTILAGATTEGSRIVQDFVRASDGSPAATVFAPEAFRTTASSAALANGAAGHAMDFDDTQLS